MLFGKILRSSEAHARIARLDVAKALALPGVRSVLSAGDIPQIRFGTAIKDRTMFAEGEVRFRGEAIAAVAATSLGDRRGGGAGDRGRVRAVARGLRSRRGAAARRAAGPCRLERLPGAAGVRPRGQHLRPLGDRRRRRRGGLRPVLSRLRAPFHDPARPSRLHRAARCRRQLGRQRRRHRLEQHAASVRHEEHAGRGARPAGQQGAGDRARHRRRLRRQAARRRRALRGVAGTQVAPARSR